MIQERIVVNTPRDIESKFRKTLGFINPLMCVADIAANELIKNNTNIEINQISRKYKHKRLNIEKTNLNDITLYVNIAHIAFINSRAEVFCQDAVDFIKNNTESKDSYNIDSVDFLRRSIFQIHVRNFNLPKTTTKINEDIYKDYAGKSELAIIDFYRKIRNIELHGGISDESEFYSDTKESQYILEKYSHIPNNITKLNIRDVILLSQVWQTVAVNLCSRLVIIDNHFLSSIKQKFINHNSERRNTAIRNKLSQDFLQPNNIINTLESNGWVA